MLPRTRVTTAAAGILATGRIASARGCGVSAPTLLLTQPPSRTPPALPRRVQAARPVTWQAMHRRAQAARRVRAARQGAVRVPPMNRAAAARPAAQAMLRLARAVRLVVAARVKPAAPAVRLSP